MDYLTALLPYGIDWLNLLVRWLHLIVGIAWIGASFYFIWLDNTIRPPLPGSELAAKGVAGHLWAVHGGGFYNPQKYLVAPAELPEELHWFKWEAYWTWISGFSLLLIVYYFNASAMMIDKSVADISSGQAIAIGLGTLVVGWTVYDLLCRSALGQHELRFGLVVYLLIVATAYGLSQFLSGRAAFIHVGAMIGTIMAANVLMLIIPGQKKMVDAMAAGKLPDPIHGKKAKQRSVHNNYFTLPVLFIMISNHFGMTYTHKHSWLVLAAIIAAGVLIRHFFNLRHRGRVEWRYPLAAVLILLVLAVAIAPAPRTASAGKPTAEAATASDAAPNFGQVQAILAQRCNSCHTLHPTQAGFASPPAGIMFDTPQQTHQYSARIYRQVVELKAMPLANLTQMSEAERSIVKQWYEAGAK